MMLRFTSCHTSHLEIPALVDSTLEPSSLYARPAMAEIDLAFEHLSVDDGPARTAVTSDGYKASIRDVIRILSLELLY
jgi:hypothetical protein